MFLAPLQLTIAVMFWRNNFAAIARNDRVENQNLLALTFGSCAANAPS